MSRSVAFIRGVGGKTALKMAGLRAALADAGLADTTTLQVAGNVVFDADGRSSADAAALIRRTVREAFGHDLAVIVRTHEELADAQRRQPYVGTQEGKWLMTVFLDAPVTVSPARAAELGQAVLPEQLTVDGREIFCRYDSGVGTALLQTTWLEKQLGVVGTARNANTIGKLVELSA